MIRKNLIILSLGLSVVTALSLFFGIVSKGNQDNASDKLLKVDWQRQSEDTSARTGVKGIVEYTVRDESGQIYDHGIIHNTVNAEGIDDLFNLITGNSGSGAYDGIAAIHDAAEDPSDGTDIGDITLLLDGDTGTSGNQNPADGTILTDFGTENGNGTVSVTFVAQGAADIRQLVLTRAVEDDTVGGAIAIADNEIFAYVNVPDISLAASDTVTYTWTVDVD